MKLKQKTEKPPRVQVAATSDEKVMKPKPMLMLILRLISTLMSVTVSVSVLSVVVLMAAMSMPMLMPSTGPNQSQSLNQMSGVEPLIDAFLCRIARQRKRWTKMNARQTPARCRPEGQQVGIQTLG